MFSFKENNKRIFGSTEEFKPRQRIVPNILFYAYATGKRKIT